MTEPPHAIPSDEKQLRAGWERRKVPGELFSFIHKATRARHWDKSHYQQNRPLGSLHTGGGDTP